MGGGVALFDFDNDGDLDIFFTNGARIDDPMLAGAKPDKSDRKSGIAFIGMTETGSSPTSRKGPACRESAPDTEWAWQSATMTTMVTKTCM